MERVYWKGTKPGGLTFRVRYNTVDDQEDTRYLVISDCEDITEAKNLTISIVEGVGGSLDASSIVATPLWRDDYKPLVELNADVLRARINELEEPPKWAKFIATCSWLVTAFNMDVEFRWGDWAPNTNLWDEFDFEDLGVLSNDRSLSLEKNVKVPVTENWREALHTEITKALSIDIEGQNA